MDGDFMNNKYIQLEKYLAKLILQIKLYSDKVKKINFNDYGINEEDLNNIENLTILIEIAKYIQQDNAYAWTMDWKTDNGYYPMKSSNEISKALKFLEPIEKEMVGEDYKNLDEILNEYLPKKTLPEGVDKSKYGEIFNNLSNITNMYQHLFIVENILRKLLINKLEENGIKDLYNHLSSNLKKNIDDRKKEEKVKKYLPFRGENDLYYLDFKELKHIITKWWNKIFKNIFPSQDWINTRIDELYHLRCRVAHNSSVLTINDLDITKTYCESIIVQIDEFF